MCYYSRVHLSNMKNPDKTSSVEGKKAEQKKLSLTFRVATLAGAAALAYLGIKATEPEPVRPRSAVLQMTTVPEASTTIPEAEVVEEEPAEPEAVEQVEAPEEPVIEERIATAEVIEPSTTTTTILEAPTAEEVIPEATTTTTPEENQP